VGTFALTASTGSGSSRMIAAIVSAAVFRAKAFFPVAIS
jgi:hypothetical protein